MYDLIITDIQAVADSILLEVKKPSSEQKTNTVSVHNMNSIKHLRECKECDQLQGKLEDDAREED